jgi:hypothetical protein
LKNLLIFFYRNPELGKVKTRLAKTLGDEKALAIYLRLSAHTRTITQDLSLEKVVYYSHFVDPEDAWLNPHFQKKVQHGKMHLRKNLKKAMNQFVSSALIASN